MARYSGFLGHRVEVHYRAGDIVLPASGTFVADSGRSIFLEQSFLQHGQPRHFRWEIPYQYIVRLEEKRRDEESTAAAGPKLPLLSTERKDQLSRVGGSASPSVPPLLPIASRPKTA